MHLPNCLIFRTISSHENTQYCEYEDSVGFVEYYDLSSDPYQLFNFGPQMDEGLRQKYKAKLNRLRGCKGSQECFQDE